MLKLFTKSIETQIADRAHTTIFGGRVGCGKSFFAQKCALAWRDRAPNRKIIFIPSAHQKWMHQQEKPDRTFLGPLRFIALASLSKQGGEFNIPGLCHPERAKETASEILLLIDELEELLEESNSVSDTECLVEILAKFLTYPSCSFLTFLVGQRFRVSDTGLPCAVLNAPDKFMIDDPFQGRLKLSDKSIRKITKLQLRNTPHYVYQGRETVVGTFNSNYSRK